MAEKVMVSCQIPPDWQEKIERLAAERKKEPSHIVYEALAQYLGEDILTADTRLLVLETEVAMLKSQLKELSATFKNLQQQLHAAASIMTIPYGATAKSPQNFQEVQANTDEDEIEDEPDEILLDFLPPEQR